MNVSLCVGENGVCVYVGRRKKRSTVFDDSSPVRLTLEELFYKIFLLGNSLSREFMSILS